MTISFAKEVAAGFLAAVLEEPDPMERLRKARQLSTTLAAEAAAGLSVGPALARAVRVHRSLPVAGTPPADSTIGRDEGGPYGVVLHPSLRYGPGHRHLLDIYVPYKLYSRRRAAAATVAGSSSGNGGAAAGSGGQLPRAPVVFFVHGGIWATGDRFHFAPLAVRLAQAGLVVAVISYTLYPEAYADTMAAETLRALMWTLSNVSRFGGDPSRLAVMGHSAGGHLGALACLLLAALRTEEAAGRTPKQPQQQQQQQQQQGTQQAAGAGGGDDWVPGPALALPRPQLFVGMSGIYHVARHHEFEESRGVHQISTMGRACGGPELWDEISPAAILARATAAATAATAAATASPSPAGDGLSATAVGNGSFYGAFALAGEAVPYRIGLDVSPSGAAAAAAEAAAAAAAAAHGGAQRRRRHHGRHHYGGQLRQQQGAEGPQQQQQQQQQQQGHELVSEFDQHRGRQEGLVDAVALLQGLTVQVAGHMPPAVLMSSLGDHMVQMHEAQEYAARLLAVGVPVKHLVYGGNPIRHNDFVFGLRPLPYPYLSSPSTAGDITNSSNGSGGVGPAAAAAAAVSEADGLELSDLPPFGRDLLLILLGKVRVRFLTAAPATSKL